MTFQDIEHAGGIEESEVLEAQFKKEIKGATKDVHLTFYREVVQCFEEVSAHNADGKYHQRDVVMSNLAIHYNCLLLDKFRKT